MHPNVCGGAPMKAPAGSGHTASRQTTVKTLLSRTGLVLILLLLLVIGLSVALVGGLSLCSFGRLVDLDPHRGVVAAALFDLQPHAHGLADCQLDGFFTTLGSDHGVLADLDVDGAWLF